VASLPDPRTRLLVVGADPSPRGREMSDDLRRRCGGRLVLHPPQPFQDAPRALAAADVVAIPSRPSQASQGQMPAKVFDAMAMAKPVVATAVSDLPEVLEGCGRTVAGADPGALAAALQELLADPALRREMGKRARARCVERYSHAAMRPVVQKFVAEALA
jgi:glycosyltransferase involved in cell wall biosynthesis